MRNLLAFCGSAAVMFLIAASGCMPLGSDGGGGGCKADVDCAGGVQKCLPTGACVPHCTSDTGCGSEQKCSAAGGCVPKTGCGADNECGKDKVCETVSCVASCQKAGCAMGSTCQSDGHCSKPSSGAGGGSGASGGGASCGGELFQASRVPANFLIVLDQSGSMEEKLQSGASKWSVASVSLRAITSQNEKVMRFGLSMFPIGAKCSQGENFVPVGDSTAAAISAALPMTATGNGTPIGAALRLASERPDIQDPARANFVLLVTDGMENCGGNPVNEVKALFGKSVKTYVVGFGSDVDPKRLSEMATEGGTARLGQTKYYQADDQASLTAAFQQIAQGAVGCDYKLAKAPPDLGKVHVAVNGGLIPRDSNKQNGWEYNDQTQRLTLYGAACDVVQKALNPNVQIIYGCPDGIIEEGPGSGDGGYIFTPDGGGGLN